MRGRISAAALSAALIASGCAGLTDTEQRLLTGTTGGAAAGAAIGAIAGDAALGAGIGAATGLVGGFLLDRQARMMENSYNRGFNAGQRTP